MKIETNGKFVSNSMIDATLKDAQITGVSGVPQSFLDSLKVNVLPSFGMQLRPKLEDAIKKSLSLTFEKQLASWMGGDVTPELLPGEGESSVSTLMSELGAANMSFKKYVDLMECSLWKRSKKPIPSDYGKCSNLYLRGR